MSVVDKTNLNNPATSNQTCRYLGVYSCMLCKFRDWNFDPPQITNFWWGICMNVHFHVMDMAVSIHLQSQTVTSVYPISQWLSQLSGVRTLTIGRFGSSGIGCLWIGLVFFKDYEIPVSQFDWQNFYCVLPSVSSSTVAEPCCNKISLIFVSFCFLMIFSVLHQLRLKQWS